MDEAIQDCVGHSRLSDAIRAIFPSAADAGDRLRRGASRDDAALYATATVLGKVPEAVGVLSFARERARKRA